MAEKIKNKLSLPTDSCVIMWNKVWDQRLGLFADAPDLVTNSEYIPTSRENFLGN